MDPVKSQSTDRATRIRQIVADCIARRTAGERVSDKDVIAAVDIAVGTRSAGFVVVGVDQGERSVAAGPRRRAADPAEAVALAVDQGEEDLVALGIRRR